jgi:hypothetical protein
VRVAWADDAEAIAGVQARAWATSYAGLVPAAGGLRQADFAQLWRDALTRPADARHRALVALERNRVVGFAITTPATDPDCDRATDGELHQLRVADLVAVRVGGRGRDHEAHHPVAFERHEGTMPRVCRPGQRVPPQLGEVRLTQIAGRRHQRGVRRGPGAGLDRSDGLGVIRPGDAHGDVGGGAHAAIVAAGSGLTPTRHECEEVSWRW